MSNQQTTASPSPIPVPIPTSPSPIPMFTPLRDYGEHREEYQENINRVLEHGRFINGPEIAELEGKLAEYVGVKHCVAVASGTDALLVGLMALGVKPGDEVITVAHTWISTAEVVAVLGAKPVFVDIDPETFLMDLDRVEELVTDRTVGIIYVSLYGQMENPTKICQLAERLGLWVMEDGAQSFGSYHQSGNDKVMSCSWGQVGCTSFFPSKPLGGYGDSGACFTDDDEMALKLKAIKNHGGLARFQHQYVGLNARMDTIQAAILLVKLKSFISGGLARRREIADFYDRELSGVEGLTIPKRVEGNAHAWAQYSLLLTKDGFDRDTVVSQMKEKGVAVAVFYPKGLHEQVAFGQVEEMVGKLPNTDYVCGHVLNLPLFPELEEEELNRVVAVVREIMLQSA